MAKSKIVTTRFTSILLMAAFLFNCGPKQVDYKPFDKLDLTKECAVYFIASEGDRGDFEETYGAIVLTDNSALQNIKDNWQFTKTDKRMPCGFGYLVFITQADSLIETIAINEPCGYAVTAGGWYDFDSYYYDFIDLTKIRKLTPTEVDSVQTALLNRQEK